MDGKARYRTKKKQVTLIGWETKTKLQLCERDQELCGEKEALWNLSTQENSELGHPIWNELFVWALVYKVPRSALKRDPSDLRIFKWLFNHLDGRDMMSGMQWILIGIYIHTELIIPGLLRWCWENFIQHLDHVFITSNYKPSAKCSTNIIDKYNSFANSYRPHRESLIQCSCF